MYPSTWFQNGCEIRFNIILATPFTGMNEYAGDYAEEIQHLD